MATNSDRWRPRPGPVRLLCAALLMASASGCGQPQVAGDHRELVLRLATGSSARDRGIIDRAASEVDRLSVAGELADAEESAFRPIIDAAVAGDWDRAQRLSYALRDGQRPTEADRQRVASRALPGMKQPGSRRPAPPSGPP